MTADRKKPGVAFWATVVVVVLVLYVLSVGPAAVLMHKGLVSRHAFGVIYWPLMASPAPVYNALNWYGGWWLERTGVKPLQPRRRSAMTVRRPRPGLPRLRLPAPASPLVVSSA
jgi:hypothetical protein